MTRHSDEIDKASIHAAESSLITPSVGNRGKRLRRDLRASIVDGAAFGGMVGFSIKGGLSAGKKFIDSLRSRA